MTFFFLILGLQGKLLSQILVQEKWLIKTDSRFWDFPKQAVDFEIFEFWTVLEGTSWDRAYTLNWSGQWQWKNKKTSIRISFKPISVYLLYYFSSLSQIVWHVMLCGGQRYFQSLHSEDMTITLIWFFTIPALSILFTEHCHFCLHLYW